MTDTLGETIPTESRRTRGGTRCKVRSQFFPSRTPPSPGGRPGGKAGGFTASGLTNTELGDAVEAAIIRGLKVFTSDLPEGKRQGAFDLRVGDRVFEVKSCTVQATEYKAKPKKEEVTRKLKAARRRKLKPCTIIAVVDGKRVHVYWREGLGAFRLTYAQGAWNYAGAVRFP